MNKKQLYQLVRGTLLLLLIFTGCATPPKPDLAPAPTPPPRLAPSFLEGETTVTGSGIPYARVEILLNGNPIIYGTIADKGTFNLEVPPLMPEQVVTAIQTFAGQTSAPSLPVSVKRATLTQIEIHPALPMTIDPGQTLAFIARGLFSDGRIENPLSQISWSIKNPAVATIDAAGTVVGIEAGITTIQANRDKIQSQVVTVRVKPKPPVITAALKTGDTSIHGTSTPSASIKIMINEIPLRTQIFADTQGKWQFDGLPSLHQDDQITCMQLVQSVQSAPSVPVVVDPPALTQIAIYPKSSAIVEQGQTQSFTATGTFSNGRMEDPMPRVTWAIENPTVATIDTEGKVTGIEAGTTTIQATRDGVQSAHSTLTVQPRPPVVTSPLKAGDTIVAGEATPTASIQILKNGVSLGIVLRTDAQGHWQATGLPPLNEKDLVTSTQLVNGIQSAPSISIVVAPAVLTKIGIQPAPTAFVDVGQSRHFTATGTFSDGRVEDPLPGVTWLREKRSVVTINAEGLVTGIGAGTTTIQATYEGVESAPTTITVQPLPPVVTSSLKAGDTIVAGSARSLANIQILMNGTPLEATAMADSEGTWKISDLPPLKENDQVTATQIINNIHSESSEIIKVRRNNPPILAPLGDHVITVGETLKLTLNAHDPEGDEISFEAIDQSLPSNSLLDSETGLFTFTPSADQVGTSTLTFLVSDGYASQQETITVKITLPKSLVVLLESPDGTVGTIEVGNAAGSQLLDKAGQAVGLGSSDKAPPEPFMLKEEDIREAFKDALEAKPEEPVDYLLYFEKNTKLTAESELLLPEIISVIADRSSPDVSIIGHSDRSGSDELNYRVSLKRATSIRDALMANGIDSQLMEVTSHGENNPVVKTPDGVSEPLNRRVEIIIR